MFFSPRDENDTSYVAAFSNKATYLNFLSINQTLGNDYQKRLKMIESLESFNPEKITVDYFYLPKKSFTQKIISKFNQKKFLKIFENDEGIIYNRLYEGKISNNFGHL